MAPLQTQAHGPSVQVREPTPQPPPSPQCPCNRPGLQRRPQETSFLQKVSFVLAVSLSGTGGDSGCAQMSPHHTVHRRKKPSELGAPSW